MIDKKPKRRYTIVYDDDAMELGSDAARLLSRLQFYSRRFKKDDHGYFEIFGTYIAESLGFSKRKFIRERDKLVKAGRIKYIAGRNQNAKSRYKIVL